MKVETVPVTFKYAGNAYNIEGTKFKPSREVMYRFVVEVPKKHEMVIILYESPTQKLNWEFESEEYDQLAKIIAKALKKIT